jgi:hypothetical protein
VSRLGVVLGLALLAGCGGGDSSSSGPADPLTIVVESEALVPVGSACHVRGTIRNATLLQTFDVILRWEAFDATAKSIGTTRITLENLLPQERRLYDATGFASNDLGLVPCVKIARFERIQTSASSD